MTDIESRLRAAMESVTEAPPAGLMAAVRVRHRRYVRRVAAASAAAAIAVVGAGAAAAPPLIRMAVSPPGGPAPLVSPVPKPTAVPSAAPGTALAGCDSANPSRIDWSTHSAGRLGASPLWYLSGGHSSGTGAELYAGLMVIAGVRPGSAVVIRVAPAGQGQLRFLFGPGDSVAPGTVYSRSSGESGVTFVACPPGSGSATEPGNVTVYYGGFLAGAGQCVPVEIWWTGHRVPARARLGACGGPG